MEKKENVSLKEFTTLKVGGNARFFISTDDPEELIEIFSWIKKEKLPFFILGGGSNVLFPDEGFNGAILKIEFDTVILKEISENVFVEAGAGQSWDEFVSMLCKKNIWGLENLSGIPGTVGASVVQNIGAYGAEVKDVVSKVEVFDIEDMTFKELSKDECQFAYRDSFFKKESGKKFVVTRVFFNLSKKPKPNLSYKDLSVALSPDVSDIKKIREVVIQIRSKKFPNLLEVGTAGSFFKNILISKEDFKKVKNKFPEIVSFEAESGLMKISSAYILDKICGLRDFREGNVGLFKNQALVLVNYGEATSREIKSFAEKIKFTVREKTNLTLEEEVVLV